jgi:hypothetical protein
MKKVWNEERDALLRRLYPTAHLGSLAARLGVTEKALRSRAKVLGLRRKVNVKRPWTQRQIAYLTKNYADTPIDVLIVKTKHDQKSIWNKAKALGLRKSREFLQAVGRHCAQHPKSVATRFVKGQEPSNKGKRIEEFMSKEGIERSSRTRFQPVQLPHNTQPVGHERVSKDGYIYIKVSMTEKMVLKHRYVWEQANGPVPDGHCVAFRDGNRQNCELSNLYLLSRGDNARRRTQEETPEQRRIRVERCQASRNKSIRRDKIRLHWGLEPYGKLVKRW